MNFSFLLITLIAGLAFNAIQARYLLVKLEQKLVKGKIYTSLWGLDRISGRWTLRFRSGKIVPDIMKKISGYS